MAIAGCMYWQSNQILPNLIRIELTALYLRSHYQTQLRSSDSMRIWYSAEKNTELYFNVKPRPSLRSLVFNLRLNKGESRGPIHLHWQRDCCLLL